MGQHQQTNRQQRIIIDQQHQIQTTRIQGVPGINLIHTTYPKEIFLHHVHYILYTSTSSKRELILGASETKKR